MTYTNVTWCTLPTCDLSQDSLTLDYIVLNGIWNEWIVASLDFQCIYGEMMKIFPLYKQESRVAGFTKMKLSLMCCMFYRSITVPFKTEDYEIYFKIWSQAALVFDKQTFVQP